jgi:hypothetical protein
MSRWATCSRILALLVLALGLPWRGVRAQERLTQEEALRLAFPAPLVIERRTAFLADSDLVRARAMAGPEVEMTQRVITYYVARRDSAPVGAAFFDSHRVRTDQEVVMVVIGSGGDVARVEVLRFEEPPEYRAPPRWLEQFRGTSLNDELAVRRGIANLTGASLTSRAIVRSVRRVLALSQIIGPLSTPPGR